MSPTQPKTTTAQGFTRFYAIVAEANRLDKVGAPYNNARPPNDNQGYDCSSSCADLMIKAGYQVPYFNTATAPQYMKNGQDPTGRVTFWNSDHSGTAGNSVHIFVTINGRDFGTSSSNPGGGPGWAPHTKSGFTPYHIDGLDEQASIPKNANISTDGNSSGGPSTGIDPAEAQKVAKAAAFATYLQFPSAIDQAESIALRGERSLMNDQPLLPIVQQMCKASLRRFQSMPNGNFFAFYPDYFGGLNHRTAYWEIADIEIIDGRIELSDDALATHVYTVGDIVSGLDGITTEDRAKTSGVVNIFNAFVGDLLGELPTQETKSKPPRSPFRDNALTDKGRVIAFLQKYGARPSYEEFPMVRSPYFELFLAYQKFCFLWSQQFSTTFEFTYMPELFPGGIVSFPDHGIQMFIEAVDHTFDYETGFTTQANLVAPASLPGASRTNVHEGMIRSHALVGGK